MAPNMDELKKMLPKGSEYLADLAFEVAPQYGVHPLTILSITGHESRYGQALNPKGPTGTGDYFPRFANAQRDEYLRKYPMPGLLKKQAKWEVPDGKGGKEVREGVAWVPTTEGWGHGLYQIDWMSHGPFLVTGAWKDPKEAMKYALNLYATNRDQIGKKIASVHGLDLWRASVASYNAGAVAVIRALEKGVRADQLDQGTAFAKGGTRVTFGPNYVSGIEKTVFAFAAKAFPGESVGPMLT